MTPAAGRFATSKSSPERQLRRVGDDDPLVRFTVTVDQEDQPALGEVRVAQALIDHVRVAQRPPGLPSCVELAPHAVALDAQL